MLQASRETSYGDEDGEDIGEVKISVQDEEGCCGIVKNQYLKKDEWG